MNEVSVGVLLLRFYIGCECYDDVDVGLLVVVVWCVGDGDDVLVVCELYVGVEFGLGCIGVECDVYNFGFGVEWCE